MQIAISLSETHLAKSVLSFHETTSSFSFPHNLAQVHWRKEHRIAIYCTTDALLQAYSSRVCRCEWADCTWEPASPKARRSQRRRNIKRYTEGKRTPQLIGHWCNLLNPQKDDVMKKSIVVVNEVLKNEMEKRCVTVSVRLQAYESTDASRLCCILQQGESNQQASLWPCFQCS